MANTEKAVAFATECLGWMYTKHNEVNKNGWVVSQFRWWNPDGSYAYGTRTYCSMPYESLPPFGEDTPEGWAAHKQWVAPWIEELGLEYCYDSGGNPIFTLRQSREDLPSKIAAIAYGPLPSAAISACLAYVRRENK